MAALYTLHTVTVYVTFAGVAALYTLHTVTVCVTFADVAALYTLHTVTVCVIFAGVAALYTLHSHCVCYLCRCGCTIYFTYTVQALPLQMRLHLRQAPMLLHLKRTLSPADTM